MGRATAGAVLGLVLVAACGAKDADRPVEADTRAQLPQDQQDAETLGQELFELVDRAIDYRGSHQGRPASSFRQMGVDSLIICGESTSGCVRASTVDAYSYGFHNVVVEECTYDRSMLSHKVNLFDLHHKYADVMHVEEVIAHLGAMPMVRAAE